MTKIKICGLRRIEDVEMVNRYLPEYAGFVFAPSSRQVTAEEAGILKKALVPEIQSVGVFVDAPFAEIVEICKRGIIDVVQLHGHEDADTIRAVKEATGKTVIKAVRVQNKEQVEAAQKLPCDFLLLDTFRPGAAGGTGEDFDLSILPKLGKPFFLAGGLRPENVRAKMDRCCPYGVDVSSGVEQGGWKEEMLIRQFVQEVRS
ncbi:MAG: phosphoribosylanthranilate isomerase [Blautia sp.]|jgi:phosphoribosylanthranilate isomerase